MEFVRARSAGFCMGVSLALRKLDQLIEENKSSGAIYILGPIIHNPQVVKDYSEKGVVIVEEPGDIPSGATVVIRAHGITRQLQEQLVARGVDVIDATCPKVKDACFKIDSNTSADRTLLLFGEEEHPEIKCLLSYAAGRTIVFNSLEALKKQPLDRHLDYCLAAQTTQDRAVFDDISSYLQTLGLHELKILNTICDATRRRQGEAIELADQVDFFVVAGGYNSSNTRRLAQVVETAGVKSLHVETADELPLDALKKYNRVGLTAGASTPKSIIDDIQSVLEKL